jgi:hypothetical protein
VIFFLNRSLLSKTSSSRLVLSLFLSFVQDNQAEDVSENVNELLLLFLFFLIRCLLISLMLVLFFRGVLLFITAAFRVIKIFIFIIRESDVSIVIEVGVIWVNVLLLEPFDIIQEIKSEAFLVKKLGCWGKQVRNFHIFRVILVIFGQLPWILLDKIRRRLTKSQLNLSLPNTPLLTHELNNIADGLCIISLTVARTLLALPVDTYSLPKLQETVLLPLFHNKFLRHFREWLQPNDYFPRQSN